MERIDPSTILAGLKDFQRDSVDYVFRRMYLDEDRVSRFLLADEVGLGKTLVARGVVARVIDHLWETVPRIDVVYICSNHDIARQNIQRLNVIPESDAALPSRITLLPITVHDLKSRKLNFITFTPGTSFSLKSHMGTVEERALLYWMLKQAWELRGTGPMNVLQGNASTDAFRRTVHEFDRDRIDDDLLRSFQESLELHQRRERPEGRGDIHGRFQELSERFRYARTKIPENERWERSSLVGELRTVLAASCLKALEPDLVILDEFQRFKDLLDLEAENDANLLAREMFEFPDVRILLLSATPYKMYTLVDEAGGEDHYQDFLRTFAFLEGSGHSSEDLAELLRRYRREVMRAAGGDGRELPVLRDAIQKRLRRVMVRTERLSVTSDRSGMLSQVTPRSVSLSPADLESYLGLARISQALGHAEPVEYWKSSPYALSFMDEYKLKDDLIEALKDARESPALIDTLRDSPSLLIEDAAISRYASIDAGNARLRSLLADTVDLGLWRLLWLPPSLPYYRLGEPYGTAEAAGFTKRLVFSSWRVVPKAITCLLSYEAERRMISLSGGESDYSAEARKRRRPLLRFARSEGRLTGMAVLGMLYPSFALAEACDPLKFAASARGSGSDGSDQPRPLDELLRWAEVRICSMLDKLPVPRNQTGVPDESWYWAAPILLDRAVDRARTTEWFDQELLAGKWSAVGEGEETDENPEESRWGDHVARARDLLSTAPQLGPPPADLASVLALLAVAGPGVASLRALHRLSADESYLRSVPLRNAAGGMAWSYLRLFNLPESTALIRHLFAAEAEEAYWLAVLRYCVNGGLQPVLDEYVHVLRDALGLFSCGPNDAVEEIARTVASAITLRTSRLGVDVRMSPSSPDRPAMEKRPMRARFAVRFGQEEAEDGGQVTHADQVRSAFNSPFWPFVLTTTSVGQEGLDFHLFCHAVVHWNLPANPVDLEQREGRVHRYKGHAIRKNLARHYGVPPEAVDGGDPWRILFQRGLNDRTPGQSDLVPFWVFLTEGGARIERHVPHLPMSRDAERLATLRRSLAVYRMVFGQARQEELVEYLIQNVGEGEIGRVMEETRFELGPPGR